MKQKIIYAIVILILLTITTLAVGAMIRDFLMVILLASLTAALVYPLFRNLNRITKGKRSLSATITLLILIAGVLIPLSTIMGMFIGQAVQLSAKVKPVIDSFMANNSSVESVLATVPYGDVILSYKPEILAKSGEIISAVSKFFVNSLSAITMSGIQFLFMLFLYLYSLFFLIRDGKSLLRYVMHRIPLPQQNKTRLLDRFVSVSRATVKGTLLIGAIQGGLAGIAMGLAGIDSALFWSIIMMFLSIIPVLGTTLVWLPACIFLYATGHVVSATILLLWCGIIVSNIDNVLRPKLVGQDTGLHELLILFSTLGGLALFGMAGFLVGPILAALWVTLWDIYGEIFDRYLTGAAPVEPERIVEPRAPSRPPITQRKESSHNSNGDNHWLKKEFRRSRKGR